MAEFGSGPKPGETAQQFMERLTVEAVRVEEALFDKLVAEHGFDATASIVLALVCDTAKLFADNDVDGYRKFCNSALGAMVSIGARSTAVSKAAHGHFERVMAEAIAAGMEEESPADGETLQ